MRLIADSGSTKTAWHIGDADFETHGINPFHQTDDEITGILQNGLRPQLPTDGDVTQVFFYGAGCTPRMVPRMKRLLTASVGEGVEVEIGSDMLGAARALCRKSEGIACILGTGANSCYYDGTDVADNVSPLGYILGDEGSAAYIGKRLVGDVLKRQMPHDICNLFFAETGADADLITDKVYREPMANRYLGLLSRFCQRHRDLEDIHTLLVDCFCQFFTRNVAAYKRHDLDVCFVGSVAHFYRSELSEAAAQCGFKLGTVMRTPMEGLIKYHDD